MSTRSYICKELPNGKYKTIYCHFDGYVDHNGLFLNDIYNTEKKVDELINLGNLSSLGLVIKPSKKKEHTFENPQRYVCVAYDRDRNEENQEAKELTIKDMFKNYWIEYFYIFTRDKKWVYSDSWFNDKKIEKVTEEELKYTFKSLSDEINRQCSDEQRKELKEMFKALESENDEEM